MHMLYNNAQTNKTEKNKKTNKNKEKETDRARALRENLKKSSFNLWRKRVRGRKTKHAELRDFSVGRHQSYDHTKHKS